MSEKKTVDKGARILTDTHDIQEVFDYWVELCRPSKRGRKPILDTKRKAKLKAGLKYFSVADMKLAVDGNVSSAFHQGDNPRRTKYDEIDLIFRDVAHIERFIDIAEAEPTATAAEEFLQEFNNDGR